ncbi:hypothetical protein GMO_14460 [Gluconobacter morbifer G707]|uniref:DUF4142 domain-containing protein n=1 Tax=Gluconobacter morbifer G707 TaxID=1088869 RepID=G6XIN6_9PROT|nr:hypothetical protein GMO_14460 [Gluconobacter morbifer G707]
MGLLAALAACTSADAPPAPALPSAPGVYKLSTADAAFLQQVDELDQTQINIAKLAATHSNSDVVKAFATTVLNDHTTNQKAVAKIATEANLTVTPKVDDADQGHIETFDHLYGSSFDRLYLRNIVSLQTPAFTSTLKTETASGGFADVKTLASDTTKMLTDHTARAHDLMGDRTFGRHHSRKRH